MKNLASCVHHACKTERIIMFNDFSGNRVVDTTGESLEQDFDQELASYMDPMHALRTPVHHQRFKGRSSTGASLVTLPLVASASADDVWASWEAGTIVDPRHGNVNNSTRGNLNAAIAAEGPVTPVNIPRLPVGCAPLHEHEVNAADSTQTRVALGAPALKVRW